MQNNLESVTVEDFNFNFNQRINEIRRINEIKRDKAKLPTIASLNWQIYINNIFHFYRIHKLLFYY